MQRNSNRMKQMGNTYFNTSAVHEFGGECTDRSKTVLGSATDRKTKGPASGGGGQVGPGTLKMASALPRLELGRSGSLDGLHCVEFALPLCTCVRVWGHRCQRGLSTGWGNRPFRSTGNLVVSCHDGMPCSSRSDRVGAHYEPGLRLTFRSTEDRDCRTLKPPPSSLVRS
jgi:hypothetical protein